MLGLKEVHDAPQRWSQEIGQQALEIDFLAGALGRGSDASAKR